MRGIFIPLLALLVSSRLRPPESTHSWSLLHCLSASAPPPCSSFNNLDTLLSCFFADRLLTSYGTPVSILHCHCSCCCYLETLRPTRALTLVSTPADSVISQWHGTVNASPAMAATYGSTSPALTWPPATMMLSAAPRLSGRAQGVTAWTVTASLSEALRSTASTTLLPSSHYPAQTLSPPPIPLPHKRPALPTPSLHPQPETPETPTVNHPAMQDLAPHQCLTCPQNQISASWLSTANPWPRRRRSLPQYSSTPSPTLYAELSHSYAASNLGKLQKQTTSSRPKFFPDYVTTYRNDRDTLGGGVFILVHKSLISEERPELVTSCEIDWAKIKLKDRRDLYVGVFNRPKRQQGDLNELQKSLNLLSRDGKNQRDIILAGDFNCPNINWTTHTANSSGGDNEKQQVLIDITPNALLSQVHHTPTRNQNILDLVFASNPSLVKSSVSIPGICDHHIVITDFDTKPQVSPQRPRRCYKMGKANWEQMKSDLDIAAREIRDEHKRGADADTLWKMFKARLQTSMEANIPTFMLKKRQSLPWITPTIKKMLKKKQRLFKRARSTNNWSGYREYQKHCRRELRRAEWQFINGKIPQGLEQKDNKPFWRYIKARKQDNTGVAPLKDKGQLHTDSQTKANILLSHFKSVFTKVSSTPSPQLPLPRFKPITISAWRYKTPERPKSLQSFRPGRRPQSSPENTCKSDRPIPRFHLPSLPGQRKATHGLALSQRLVRLQERWSPSCLKLQTYLSHLRLLQKFSNTSSAATSFLTSNLTTFWQTSTTASAPAIPLKLNFLLQLKIYSLLSTKTNRSTWLSWTSAKPSIHFLKTAFSTSSLPTASVTRYTTGYVASSRNGTCKSWSRAFPPSLQPLTQECPKGLC